MSGGLSGGTVLISGGESASSAGGEVALLSGANEGGSSGAVGVTSAGSHSSGDVKVGSGSSFTGGVGGFPCPVGMLQMNPAVLL